MGQKPAQNALRRQWKKRRWGENAAIPEMPRSAAERRAQRLEKEVGPEGVGSVVSIVM